MPTPNADTGSHKSPKLSRTLIGVLILLWFSVFLNYIDRSNLSIAAPLLKNELHLSATQLGVLLSAFFWIYACLQIPAGWLVDRFEVKWVFAIGFLVWSSATAVTGILHGFVALLIVRAVLGVGECVAYPSYSKIIANHFPVEHRGLANAVIAAGLSAGPCFGLLFGGVLMGHFGWRPFFVILGLASLLWLPPWAAWMPLLPERIRNNNSRYNDNRDNDKRDHDNRHHDNRDNDYYLSPNPNYREIVARKSWLATALGLFTNNYVNYFLLTWLPFYLVRERGFSMTGMAEVGGATMFTAALSAIASGRLSDRWIRGGATTTRVRTGFMVVGQLCIGVFLIGAVLAPRNVSIGLFLLAGVSYGMLGPNIWAISQTLAGPRAIGRWIGAQNFIGNLSGAIGPALTGFLVDRTGHFLWPFVIAAGVAWMGVAVWIFLLGPVEPVTWKKVQQIA